MATDDTVLLPHSFGDTEGLAGWRITLDAPWKSMKHQNESLLHWQEAFVGAWVLQGISITKGM